MREPFPRIACTLGTTTDDPEVLSAMAAAGMGLARVNTAYATPEELERRIQGLRGLHGQHGSTRIPVVLDLKGSQLRIDCTTTKTDPRTGRSMTVPCRYPIAPGELICIGFGEGPVRFNHDIEADLCVGDLVTFDNGRIRTRVRDAASMGVEPVPHAVMLSVEEAGSGSLTPRMGANVPGRTLRSLRLGARDLAAAALGVRLGVEWVALSFAREAEELRTLHAVLAGLGEGRAGLMPKIEERQGLTNLEAIVEAVRACGRPVAVMVGRGDLFVELPAVELPAVQAELIRRCRALDVPVVVATGFLLGMQTDPVPSRAEVCDVAAALRQGADCVLLSDETANSRFPVAAVRMLAELTAAYAGGRDA